ncbi:hypothetical protein [uncultured Microbacterium sp.]|uniref:hypothetical protein n=1 Tax=uncultured Microbacterium sp. TaxID=191216 RepID=UPI0025D4CEC1|nr:hypothetical protein [uncultured Microbacterium sp.]
MTGELPCRANLACNAPLHHAVDETSAAAVDETDAVANNETHAVAVVVTGAVAVDETGAAANDETGTIANDETGTTANDETSTPANDETGTAANDETGTVAVHETGAVANEETGVVAVIVNTAADEGPRRPLADLLLTTGAPPHCTCSKQHRPTRARHLLPQGGGPGAGRHSFDVGDVEFALSVCDNETFPEHAAAATGATVYLHSRASLPGGERRRDLHLEQSGELGP